MAIFDQLREGYKTARESNFDYQNRCAFFAHSIARRFKEYIGAPDHYLTDPKQEQKPYVEPMKVEIGAGDEYNCLQSDGLHDLVIRDKDGYWLTGLRLTMDDAPGAVPKSHFLFLIKFIIREGECEMFVGDATQSFTFSVNDPDGLKPAFDLMVKILNDFFARKPWDTSRKNPIGFVPSLDA